MPAVPQVLLEFQVTDDIYGTLLVSIWELGEGFGPFFVGPLSERFGRMPVYHFGNLLFILCSVAAALSLNIAMLIAFRFLNGFVITSLTLGPSTVGDLFKKEERGSAMAIAIAVPLIGPFAAPIIGGLIAARNGWRWTIWMMVCAVGAISCLSLVFLRETYRVEILERKVKRLQTSTGNPLLRSRYHDAAERQSPLRAMKRPLKMLLFSPIVFIIYFYTALTYGLSYLILTTLTDIMESTYGFGEGVVGLSFLGRGMSKSSNSKEAIRLTLNSDRQQRWHGSLRRHVG